MGVCIPRDWRACHGVNAHCQRFACEGYTRSGAVVLTTQAISHTTPRCRRLLPRWSALWAPHTREPRPHHPEPRPHRHQAGGVALHGDPCVTCLPVASPSNGGNCTIRGATRRRHADRTLLMVQNPHHYPWCHAPSLVQDCPAGADKRRKGVADRTLPHGRG